MKGFKHIGSVRPGNLDLDFENPDLGFCSQMRNLKAIFKTEKFILKVDFDLNLENLEKDFQHCSP